VTDSYDTVTGISAVNIYPDPLIHLGPEDTTVCIYDTVRLDAGNPGSTYLWSNGATSRQISFGTTGIGFDEQEYSVEVTNEHGCKSFSSIEVIFNIDACTGINDLTVSDHFRMFPNPAKKMVTIEADGIAGTVKGSLLTMLGNVLQRFSMQAGSDGSSRTMLDLTGLPKGIYLVRFENAACMRIHKLVIE